MFTTILLAVSCACAKPVSLKVDLCTPENVVKALQLSEQFLPQPQFSCTDCLVLSADNTITYIGQPVGNTQSKDKRTQAKKLNEEADKLDQQETDAAFIRKILKACKGD